MDPKEKSDEQLDLLREIVSRLNELDVVLEEKRTLLETNRSEAIALIRYITDYVNAIRPDTIAAQWLGSYTNSGVQDYPCVTILAVHKPTHQIISSWTINAGGSQPPPDINARGILHSVLQGLKRL